MNAEKRIIHVPWSFQNAMENFLQQNFDQKKSSSEIWHEFVSHAEHDRCNSQLTRHSSVGHTFLIRISYATCSLQLKQNVICTFCTRFSLATMDLMVSAPQFACKLRVRYVFPTIRERITSVFIAIALLLSCARRTFKNQEFFPTFGNDLIAYKIRSMRSRYVWEANNQRIGT